MSSLKSMYTTIVNDHFPEDLKITLGDTTLVYAKRTWVIEGERRGLRYGENPDQPAALYELKEGTLNLGGVVYRTSGQGLVSALGEEHMLQAGKHPGKTNLTDVDNAVNILQYLTERPAALILKHNNPCGAAWSKNGLADALDRAFWCDRIAAFGGAVVVNRPLDVDTAGIIDAAYFEVVAAPAYEPGVLDILKKRKNLRILELPALADLGQLRLAPFLDIKALADGGLVLQQSFVNRIHSAGDFLPASATTKDGTTYIARKPTLAEADDLVFAWAVESGVTSNSVIFAKDGATVAIGTGEQDRVGCVELAIYKAYTKYTDKLVFRKTGNSLYQQSLLAQTDPQAKAILEECHEIARDAKGGLAESRLVSDGFFPFRDGVDTAMLQGVKAIAQPGGSLRDAEVIAAVNEQDVAMVFTGQRSFRH